MTATEYQTRPLMEGEWGEKRKEIAGDCHLPDICALYKPYTLSYNACRNAIDEPIDLGYKTAREN